MIGHGVFYIGIILSRNIKLTTAFMFFLGTASVGRATVGYLYMMEFTPIRQQTAVGTMNQIFNTFITILSVIYFYYISKNWIWF